MRGGALLSLSLYEPSEELEERKHCCYSSYIGKWWNCFCFDRKHECPTFIRAFKWEYYNHTDYCKVAKLRMFREGLISCQIVCNLLNNMRNDFYYSSPHSSDFSNGKWFTLSKNKKVKRYKYWICYLSKDLIEMISNYFIKL
jgi:hypothetical protein